MIALLQWDSLGVADIAILFAALAYTVHLILDALGIGRTSRSLRTENLDLVRRNHELDGEVVRLSEEVGRLKAELDVLMPQVAELQKRDQAAVLAAIAEHERAGGLRHEKTYDVLAEIRDALRAT